MENLNDEETELFKRFAALDGNLNPIKISALEKSIKRYLKFSKKYNRLLVEVLSILEIFTLENSFSNFDYYAKVTKTYSIASPIVTRLTYTEKDALDLSDLVILQAILGFVNNIEEAQKLCEKALVALEKFMSQSPNYNKYKFFYHYNMLNRALKADFFEVDKSNELESRKRIKDIFKSHLNKASEILEDKKNNVPREYEYMLNIRAAMMDRDSYAAMENIKAMKEVKAYRKLYDLARVELAEYSFYPNFELTEEHYNLAIGARVRSLRQQTGVTITELADQLGIASGGNLSLIERGEIDFSGFKLGKVAEIFGISLEELCYGVSSRPSNPVSKEEFKYSKL